MDNQTMQRRALDDLAAAQRGVAIAIEQRNTAALECAELDVPIAAIARVLGVGRPTVYRMIERIKDGHE